MKLNPADIPWVLSPFKWVTTCWYRDPDYGWLEYSLYDAVGIKETLLRVASHVYGSQRPGRSARPRY